MEQTNLKTELASPKRPLLQTKLTLPRLRTNPVVRPRLLDQLNTAVSAEGTIHPKLTLITGPAGYGKTTLATQWIAQMERPVAWLSLDASDNDEARFLAYFFAAIGTVREEIGEAALARLTTTYLYNETEAILTALLNDLAMGEETAVIVLDDYHLITAPAVHEAVTFILQNMPVQMHLIITSRSEPPLPLALLRAQDALNWIGSRDLRFTANEAAQFLQQTMGLQLTPQQITQLDEQVEGWVTGLQLIALALQESVSLPEAFSGSQRYLVDYLADQVLSRQPAEIQEFLLQTAVLTQFNASLCQAITGQPSQQLLEQIEAANLFLIPLDAARHWYRYHHLFGDFLNGRLQQQKSAAQIANLHQQAACWYYENDQPLIAVDHALAAADYDLAVTLMETVARDVLMFGEGITLRQWVEALPEDRQTSRPSLTLFYIWSLIRTGAFRKAKQLLGAISNQLDSALLWGEWSALRARLAMLTGDTEINIKFSNKALSKLPDDQHMLRSEVAINLGFSHLQRAELDAARDAFAEAAQNSTHDPGLWAVMFATFYWGQTHERQAQLKEAFTIYERGLATAVSQQTNSAALGYMHLGMGKLLYQWNRLGEAETHLRHALACAERSGDHKMLIYSRESLAQLLLTLDDWPAAESLVVELEQQIQATTISAFRADLALQRGDMRLVRQWANGLGIAIGDEAEKIQDLPGAYLLLAEFHIANREYEAVPSVLDVLCEFAEARQSKNFGLRVSLLQALLQAKMGAMETAVPTFQQTLTQAEPGGYIRLFLDTPDPSLHRLLHLAANNPVTAAYARTILTHCDPEKVPSLHSGQAETTIQPLSGREMEVLRHLAAGRSNREIANEMVLSLNTIKAHARRLYAKLDVNNRTQAVTRARDLHLLD
ncbi:LuxR C-terminal-related transcriptional regulator [Candidatus Leptofilum sp.]|uniref:LuxR C-terminal-related transcriptional regulator n=1 Tax=Candidatus Leptofilum sp. TaxID=3241576 RepID=UPI003B58CCB7